LQRIGSDEDDPYEEGLFRNFWDEETQREVVIDSLRADCEVSRGDLRVFEEVSRR